MLVLHRVIGPEPELAGGVVELAGGALVGGADGLAPGLLLLCSTDPCPDAATVNITRECGPMIMVTGSPSLSFAVTRKDSGTTLTSVKPCD